jgi:peptidoglycan/xylan/chitin deacetylase (PgdA/CDA1 family)
MMRAILFGIGAIAPLAAVALYPFGIVAALAPIFVSHLFLLYATITPNCRWWGPVVRSFETSAREVWLTIDDGPSPAHTLQILDSLHEHGARATFFVVGEQVEKYPHLLTEILTRGHQVANHTLTHPSGTFWCAGPRTIAREIDACARTLRSTPERPARFFRAPAGLTNPFVHPVLRSRALLLVGWSTRAFDTVRRDPAGVAATIKKQLRPGAIILLHEGHQIAREPQFNATCVELTLREIAAAGYRCVIPREEQLQASAGGK